MGKSLARHPVLDYQQLRGTSHLPPIPFPSVTDARPLAGIRIIEMTRVIAAPAAGAMLASLGADVIAIQSPELPNLQALSITLTAGKTTYSVDLRNEAGKKHVQDLINDADVIIQAFRLHSLERKGFGLGEVVEMSKKRGKGIIYLDLNCYGPDGYYAERPAFQQIADAATGCSYVCGRSLGFSEGTGVLPSVPIADMLSGLVAAIDVMLALRDRAKHGGSYHASSVLCSVDPFQLTKEVGLYSPETVKKVQDKFHFGAMTPDLMVQELLYVVTEAWTRAGYLSSPDNMVSFPETPFGKNHVLLGPPFHFGNADCNPRWKHGPVPYCHHQEAPWA